MVAVSQLLLVSKTCRLEAGLVRLGEFVLASPTSNNIGKIDKPQQRHLSVFVEGRTVAMIIRSITRCSATRRIPVVRPRMLQVKPRRYSSSSSTVATSNGASQVSMLGAFTNEMDRIAPRFEIQGSQIQILRMPSEFYDTLKVERHPESRNLC